VLLETLDCHQITIEPTISEIEPGHIAARHFADELKLRGVLG
jgi:hypothetical protein